jgi:hypothetical protein
MAGDASTIDRRLMIAVASYQQEYAAVRVRSRAWNPGMRHMAMLLAFVVVVAALPQPALAFSDNYLPLDAADLAIRVPLTTIPSAVPYSCVVGSVPQAGTSGVTVALRHRTSSDSMVVSGLDRAGLLRRREKSDPIRGGIVIHFYFLIGMTKERSPSDLCFVFFVSLTAIRTLMHTIGCTNWCFMNRYARIWRGRTGGIGREATIQPTMQPAGHETQSRAGSPATS